LTPTNDLVNRIIINELTTVTDNNNGTGLRPYSNLMANNPLDFPPYVPPNQGDDHPMQIRYLRALPKV
jgi:hypothetical protein